jgi:CRISPR/Cas system-associated exonuclease Cas4 (RecB family)
MIVEKILERKAAKIKLYPTHTNRASELGHVCERYLVFKRTRWMDATLHDVALQLVFDEGHLHEDAVMNDLREAGVQVIEQQRSFHWQKYNITGHIDGKIIDGREVLPIEIKSMSTYVFKSITTVDDMLHSRYAHLKKYPAQLQLYMLMDNAERGIFILKDKSSGQLKELIMPLDLVYCESLVQKTERINAHVAANTIPEPIPWDERTCGSCQFAHICLPEARREALDLTDDPDLEAQLKRRSELDPLRREYEELDDLVKMKVKGRPKVVVGDYLITGREITPKGKPPYWKSEINLIQIQKGPSNV